jgi:hypothetical protein
VANTPTDFARILASLHRHRVRFVVVGGVAAVIEGAPVATFDVDIVPDRSAANIPRLVAALRELGAHYRTRRDTRRPPDPGALAGDGHHLLMTRFGPLDVLGVVGAGRDFEQLLAHSSRRRLRGFYVRVMDLETQIAVKQELGHQKDRAVLPLLRETLKLRKRER